MEPEVRTSRARFHELDLLRFVAALSVVLYHYTFRDYAADHYSPIPNAALGEATKYGFLGVQLFFIISGYVILLSAQGKTVRQFLVSRVVRLYPAFWVACTLTFAVKLLWGTTAAGQLPFALPASWPRYLANLTMLHEFFGIASLDGVYWTLTIEITFYFLVSLLVAYRLLPRVEWCLAGWLLYAALPGRLNLDTPLTALLIPAHAPFFAAGMLFYLVQPLEGRTRLRLALLMLTYVLALRSAWHYTAFLAGYFHHAYSRPVVLGLVTTFFLVFTILTLRPVCLRGHAWLAGVGALTYPLYLLHHDMAGIVFHRFYGRVGGTTLIVAVLVLMLAAAWLLHVLAERPLGRWLGQQLPRWLRMFGP